MSVYNIDKIKNIENKELAHVILEAEKVKDLQ